MKTKNKTCGMVVALAAVLLVTAALITSCIEPLAPGSGYQPPPGKGAIYLSLGGKSANRSIMPDTPSFTHYTYSFQKYTTSAYTTPDGVATTPVQILASALSTPIALTPGFYKVIVTGRLSAGGTDAAVGTSVGFTLAVGTTESVSLDIEPYPILTATGSGTFQYTITNSGLTGSAGTITISKLAGGNTYGDDGDPLPITLNSASPVSLPIPSGIYSVATALTLDTNTAYTYDILHVYQGLTSTFTYAFNTAQFPAGTYVEIDPDYVGPTDAKPTLTQSKNGGGASALLESGSISLDISDSDEADIVITTTPPYSAVDWVVDNVSGGAATTLHIEAGVAPFDVPKTYSVTAVGSNATGYYSTKFWVVITP